eukprot:CAMPEP_0119261428 /NCGR_PEP_ID=MMETSP1329-20130426/1499_1 /TAXON_ID=114041 /ORGANISM="Genus nov. species nov., Strain RCC1024" /LENGTH=202 /DNA_ID=CAMNT_0007260987 /DNA_START=394 /DNA_END=999 /DNA_ORIENTATION=+
MDGTYSARRAVHRRAPTNRLRRRCASVRKRGARSRRRGAEPENARWTRGVPGHMSGAPRTRKRRAAPGVACVAARGPAAPRALESTSAAGAAWPPGRDPVRPRGAGVTRDPNSRRTAPGSTRGRMPQRWRPAGGSRLPPGRARAPRAGGALGARPGRARRAPTAGCGATTPERRGDDSEARHLAAPTSATTLGGGGESPWEL